jgi:hypothetical protein
MHQHCGRFNTGSQMLFQNLDDFWIEHRVSIHGPNEIQVVPMLDFFMDDDIRHLTKDELHILEINLNRQV